MKTEMQHHSIVCLRVLTLASFLVISNRYAIAQDSAPSCRPEQWSIFVGSGFPANGESLPTRIQILDLAQGSLLYEESVGLGYYKQGVAEIHAGEGNPDGWNALWSDPPSTGLILSIFAVRGNQEVRVSENELPSHKWPRCAVLKAEDLPLEAVLFDEVDALLDPLHVHVDAKIDGLAAQVGGLNDELGAFRSATDAKLAALSAQAAAFDPDAILATVDGKIAPVSQSVTTLSSNVGALQAAVNGIDLNALHEHIHGEIAAVRTELLAVIDELRSYVDAGFAAVAAQIEDEAAVRSASDAAMNEQIALVHQKVDEFTAYFNQRIDQWEANLAQEQAQRVGADNFNAAKIQAVIERLQSRYGISLFP
ncbi:MAG: hypothetical protein HYV03_00450 [Deltaproteobacteria bacterium]|nr:hypothetical protein [Deltaproteobacteria bacterium]